jgi:hypothetical protein
MFVFLSQKEPMQNRHGKTIACGSKESGPFPVSPKGKPGRDGSPHAAKTAAPPARGLRPLAQSPGSTSASVLLAHRTGATSAKQKFNFDGRHVGLDFYDLLIEARFLVQVKRRAS